MLKKSPSKKCVQGFWGDSCFEHMLKHSCFPDIRTDSSFLIFVTPLFSTTPETDVAAANAEKITFKKMCSRLLGGIPVSNTCANIGIYHRFLFAPLRYPLHYRAASMRIINYPAASMRIRNYPVHYRAAIMRIINYPPAIMRIINYPAANYELPSAP